MGQALKCCFDNKIGFCPPGKPSEQRCNQLCAIPKEAPARFIPGNISIVIVNVDHFMQFLFTII